MSNCLGIEIVNYLLTNYTLSNQPHKLNTTLTKEQEELICFERKQFKKAVEDIFFTLEDKIPNLYPMKIYRCLKRHNLATLPSVFVTIERKIKKFKRCMG